ncbi:MULTISPECIES: hypothetical protein [Shewanella]|uniref:Uncharacterized protein n=1 Tax=Shewanella japonica TaxID=93973 RepID=A0ABN4YIH5_9GAMM|nr:MULTISPECIES: hypothetical protein [Shewanella]ARD22987.1 hypothetical protein SJ2017_2701 [Shewanella japonica]
MELRKLIESIENYNDEGIIFAELIEGSYLASSDAQVIEMSDEEMSLPTPEVAEKYCSGKAYFLEVFLVKEMLDSMRQEHIGSNEACKRIIHYAVHDA